MVGVGGSQRMKLGLGLSLPGVAAMGGKLGQKLMSSADFQVDAVRSGGAFTDLGPNALTITNNGTVYNAGGWWEFTSGDSLAVADNSLWTLASGDTMTVVVKARWPSATNAPRLFSNDAGYSTGLRFYIENTDANKVYFGIHTGGGFNFAPTAAGPTFNTWHVCTGLVPAVGGAVQVRVNGTTATGSSRGGTSVDPAAPRIGSHQSGTNNFFVGDIACVYAWRRLLSADELAAVEAALA